MCSDCEDFEPACSFCGLTCYGDCDDPDKCPTCWMGEHLDDYDPAPCIERDDGTECECRCHFDEDIEAWKDCFSDDLQSVYEEMRAHRSGLSNPKLQPGVFEFMNLPGEIRDKIYHYNLQQSGSYRKSPCFKGTIETALIKTCRQVNQEARHLPLSINTLSFISPFQAYSFLGFEVVPAQKQFVKSVHVDVHGIGDFHRIFGSYLVPQFAKLTLSHLSVTLQGGINAEWFTKVTCLETCLLKVKGLTSFDLVIGSGVIKDTTKGEIVDGLRKKLLKTPETAKNPLKRKAGVDVPVEDAAVPTQGGKKVARGSSSTKSRKTAGRKAKAKKRTIPKVIAGPDPESVTGLMKKYDQLDEYARTYDPQANSVRIRLGKAHEAASEGNEDEFDRVAKDILATLEAHFAKIVKTRSQVPYQPSSPLQ